MRRRGANGPFEKNMRDLKDLRTSSVGTHEPGPLPENGFPMRALLRPFSLSLSLTAALVTGACTSAPVVPVEEPVVLRAYDCPRSLASETQSVLSSLLYRGKDVPKLGSVVLSPTGQILVSAPASFQNGVEGSLSRLQKEGPGTPPPRVQMDYILVVGKEGEAAVPKGLSPDVTKVLQDIATTEGLDLQVLDRLQLHSMSGDRAEVRDRIVSIDQTATAYGDQVLAQVGIHGKTSVEAKIQLQPGRPLVIARAGYEPRPGDAFFVDGPPEQVALFYVLVAHLSESK